MLLTDIALLSTKSSLATFNQVEPTFNFLKNFCVVYDIFAIETVPKLKKQSTTDNFLFL